jgi:hypothetical protein
MEGNVGIIGGLGLFFVVGGFVVLAGAGVLTGAGAGVSVKEAARELSTVQVILPVFEVKFAVINESLLTAPV